MVGVLCEAKDTGGCTVQVQEIRPETGFYGCLTKMSKGLNVNECNNVNTRFLLIKVFPPAVPEPSVLVMQVITSQFSGTQWLT